VVVETVRAVREGLTLREPGTLSLPQRVRDLVTRRLERLGEGSRQLLSVAAVIGREFDFTLLQRASGLAEREAAVGVEELVRRRILHGVDEGFDVTHDRIREVVYGGLLPPRRKLLHGEVAVALESLTADALDPPAAALAMHYRHAEAWDKAAVYLRRAGRTATARSALQDARAWFEQALDALDKLPESRATVEQRGTLGPFPLCNWFPLCGWCPDADLRWRCRYQRHGCPAGELRSSNVAFCDAACESGENLCASLDAAGEGVAGSERNE
jgi:hypothetical protein